MNGFAGYMIPVVGALCYGAVELVKPFCVSERAGNFYPLLAGILGAVLMLIVYYIEPSLRVTESVLETMLIGVCSGLSATGGNQVVQRMLAFFRSVPTEDDGEDETEK